MEPMYKIIDNHMKNTALKMEVVWKVDER